MPETERLTIRRWKDNDAENLYRYASDPDIGLPAGWPPHKSIRESLNIIRTVLSRSEAYALCLKPGDEIIGSIELKPNGFSNLTNREDEYELGYWLGKPFWGKGLMPEAVREMLRYAFEDLKAAKVWCGYYAGNEKSKRVQEKCGFRYQYTLENADVPMLHETRTCIVSCITFKDWGKMS